MKFGRSASPAAPSPLPPPWSAGVAGDRCPCRAEQARARCRQGDRVRAAGEAARKSSRIALVIGNGHYPDAHAPLAQPINDARALTATLRQSGFDVDVVEDASKDDMRRAVAPAEVQGQAGHRGDAVLRRLRRAGRPRELHDPGRCRDLEGSRRAARRRQHRIRAGRDEGEGRQRQAGRGRRLPPQPL